MTGKIHSSVGMATCTLIMQPRDFNELLFCMAVGTLGGLLPDIDIRNSEIRKDIKEFAICAGITGISLIAYLSTQSFSVLRFLHQINGIKLLAIFTLICTLLIGFLSNHRNFTHSIEFNLLISCSIGILSSNALFAIGVFLGILSHDLIDTLNKKKVLLSCVLKIRFCLGVCTADSKLANAIGIIAGAIIFTYCAISGII